MTLAAAVIAGVEWCVETAALVGIVVWMLLNYFVEMLHDRRILRMAGSREV